ncbi:MAG: tRNA (N(6)-L-threonylcarbamoyladenosine(37)-C(2))-methylthiotransferase MtaB, partial [Clostridia bacterium]|nr:tRNA (N(6)-L-threonylcarbamoyladenosine(37)-C(2))-methylthiotransferase MtaB [Clostridia bacterium]
GQTMRVLFEQPVKGGFFEGKTDNYITVRVKSSEHLNDEFRSVILDTITDGIAYGKIKEDIV